MYTLKEIIEAWQRCYGEDLKKEYAGFVKELIRNEKRIEIAPQASNPGKGTDTNNLGARTK